ncbi:hypothetical protein ABKN59_001666 [Abortiporus biennis]
MHVCLYNSNIGYYTSDIYFTTGFCIGDWSLVVCEYELSAYSTYFEINVPFLSNQLLGPNCNDMRAYSLVLTAKYKESRDDLHRNPQIRIRLSFALLLRIASFDAVMLCLIMMWTLPFQRMNPLCLDFRSAVRLFTFIFSNTSPDFTLIFLFNIPFTSDMFFHFTNQVVLFATLICTAMIVSSLPIPFTKSTNLNIVARDGQGAVVSSGFTRHGSVAMYRARSESKDASANVENAINEIHKAVQSAAPMFTTTRPASPVHTEPIAKRQADGGNTDTASATPTDNSSASPTGAATFSSSDATSTSLPMDGPSAPNDESNRKSGHKKHNHKKHYGSGDALGQGDHNGKRVPCSNNTMEGTTATATAAGTNPLATGDLTDATATSTDVAAQATDAAKATAAGDVTPSDAASATSTSTMSYPAAAPTGTSTTSSIPSSDGTNPQARSLSSRKNNKDDSTKHDKRFVTIITVVGNPTPPPPPPSNSFHDDSNVYDDDKDCEEEEAPTCGSNPAGDVTEAFYQLIAGKQVFSGCLSPPRSEYVGSVLHVVRRRNWNRKAQTP